MQLSPSTMNIKQIYAILIFRGRTVFILLTAFIAISAVVSLSITKKYFSVATIMVNQRSVDPITGLSLPIQTMPGYMATQLDIIGSHNVARKVVKSLKLDEQVDKRAAFVKSDSKSNIVDWLADGLLKDLDIKPSRESSLIQIGFFAKDPEMAARIANAFVESYIHTSIEMRAQPAKSSADWFDAQMVSLRERMEQAQSALSNYQQQNSVVVDLVSGNEKMDIENGRLSELSKQLLESQAQTNELQARNDLIQAVRKGGNSSESLNEVLNSALIQSLKSDLAHKQASFAELSNSIDKNHPRYKQAEAEIRSLRQQIQQQTRMVLDSLASGLATSKQRDKILSQALAMQKSKVLELKQQYDEIAVLKRDVENQQKAYDAAMQRLVQNRLESEVNHTNISVLNTAIASDKPAKPKLLLNLAIGIFLGGLFGICAALCQEWLDRRVRFASDITDTIGLPVLGFVSAEANQGRTSKFPANFMRPSSAAPNSVG